MKLLTAALTPKGNRAVDGGLQLPRPRLGIRTLGAPNEVDDHRPPEPGDLTEPPRGRLLGGTGGPFVAEVADRQFRHLVSHCHNLARAAEADAPPSPTERPAEVSNPSSPFSPNPPTKRGGGTWEG